jgi:cell division protein FtsW (lipid II flippase)
MSSARNRELLALVPVALLLTAGFAGVFAQESSELGNASLIYGAYFFAVCLATHLYLRIRLPNADPYLFPLVALLTAIGLVMVYRIDESLARDQANWFVLGLVLFALAIQFLRDYEVLERYRYLIAVGGLLLLLAPRLPGIGQQVNGAYLGVKIGPIAFQPAEFSKLAIVIFLASYLRENREVLVVGARRILGVTLPPLKHFGPMLVVWGASMFMLVFIRDLGSSLMFFAAFLALLYVATGRFSFVVIGMAMFVVGAWFFAETVPHVHDRIEIWLHPYNDPQGTGYQILNSIFAQADGGLFGKGFGQALITIPGPNDALLPAAQTDTIYSLIVNELGLFGACGVILIYLLVAARGFKIALLADDGFSKLLATGLTAVFAIQAFVIIGGVTRVIPLTGVTLPFVSYGGSSIVANFVLLALLLLISDRPGARRSTGGRAAMERRVNRQIVKSVRLHRRPLRGPDRLHVLLVGLRRRGAEGKGRQQAAAARAAADPPRPHPRRRRHRDREVGRRRARANLRYVRRYPKARSSATRSATASSSTATPSSSSSTTTS